MKKKKTEKKLIALSVVVTILCLVLTYLEVTSCRSKILEHHGKHLLQQMELLEETAELRSESNAVSYSDALISLIQERTETNSRHFSVVCRNEELLYLRDRTMTLEYHDKNPRQFFMEEEPVPNAKGELRQGSFLDGEQYVYAVGAKETKEGVVTLAICTQREYVWKETDADILYQRLFVYLGLTLLAYVASVSWLANAYRRQKTEDENLNEQLTKNRVLIDKLVNKLDARMSGALVDEDGGLYSREIVEQVMDTMTPEQKKRSYCLMIDLQEESPDLLVRLSVVLDRLLTGGSICCLWEKNQFRAVLMNVEEEVAITLSKQLIMQYQRMFQQDLTKVTVKVLHF